MALILGSKSPRRKEILSQVTTDFIVKVSDADENIGGQIDPFYLPVELAKIKAESIECQKDDIVIGCDTVVILNDKILGKPKTLEESTEMLKDLSGTCHYVVSGLAIKRGWALRGKVRKENHSLRGEPPLRRLPPRKWHLFSHLLLRLR